MNRKKSKGFKKIINQIGSRKKKQYKSRYKSVLDVMRTTRRAMDLTQEELSIMAGISRSTIARIESGEENVEVETLMRLANAMKKELEIVLK